MGYYLVEKNRIWKCYEICQLKLAFLSDFDVTSEYLEILKKFRSKLGVMHVFVIYRNTYRHVCVQSHTLVLEYNLRLFVIHTWLCYITVTLCRNTILWLWSLSLWKEAVMLVLSRNMLNIFPIIVDPFFFLIILCVWIFCLHVYLCSTHMPGTQGIQKKVLDSLGLEVEMFLSHHVGLIRNRTWVLEFSSITEPCPQLIFFSSSWHICFVSNIFCYP